MPYADLREFVEVLEKHGELKRVPCEVDWKYEVGGWIQRTYDMVPRGPALLFEKIKGYPPGYRILAGALGSYRRFALALGLDPNTSVPELVRVYKERARDPLKPRLVSSGPVKECIHRGNDVNLLALPVPWLHPKDGGRYIGVWHGIVTKDAETGITNVGCYRIQVSDEKRALVGFLPASHMGYHYSQRESGGKPLEMAVVIGADETVVMAAGTRFPPNVDELAMAGALRQEPLDLVRCETIDVQVPANSEIVLEGHLLPYERAPEGPLGEYTGYHGGGIRMRPIFQVAAITHRRDPILRTSLRSKPIWETPFWGGVARAAAALSFFETNGPPVLDAHYPAEVNGTTVAILQIRPHYVGHSRNVARALLASHIGFETKYVVVVDDDINIYNLGEVWWAIATRTQGSRDIEVLPFGPTSRSDPSVPRDRGEYTDTVIIDATKKLDYPYNPAWNSHWAPVATPPPEIVELADAKWRRFLDGDSSLDNKVAELTRRLERELSPQWEKWREKAYTMNEEERRKEIARSYPIVHDDG